MRKCKCNHVKSFHKNGEGKCFGQLGRCKCLKFEELQ